MMTGSTQTNFDPRPYQNECVQAMLHYTGHAAITSLAVGLGKTKITTDFARGIVKRGGRVLLLAHREELVRNPVDNYLRDIRCGIERGAEHARRDEPIISASVQSLSGARLKQYPHDYFSHICIDEAHHAVCSSYRKILDYFSGYQLFGTTATCHRYDGEALGQIFDDVLFVRDLRFGIENGYLCDIDCRRVQLQYDLGKCTFAKEILCKPSLSRRFPAPPKVLPRSTSVTLWVKPSFSACLPQKRKPPQTALTTGTAPLRVLFWEPRKTVRRFCKILPPERSKCLPLIRYLPKE